jgi:uncharacterized protein with PIN domain
MRQLKECRYCADYKGLTIDINCPKCGNPLYELTEQEIIDNLRSNMELSKQRRLCFSCQNFTRVGIKGDLVDYVCGRGPIIPKNNQCKYYII